MHLNGVTSAWEKMSYMFEMTDNLHCFIENIGNY